MEQIKAQVQQKALNSWLEHDKKGTIEMITGFGKTFISLHALCTMPKDKNIIHLFLAETIERERDLMKEIVKYKKIFGIDILKEYNLQFYCYQTVYKWKNKSFGLIISDEIHDALSPEYSKFFYNNTYNAIIGLSATINKKTEYVIDNIKITKGDLLNEIAPICFKYTLDDGRRDDTIRELKIYVIQHRLDNKEKIIKSGNKKTTFYQTEKDAYEYWDNRHKKAWYLQDEEQKKLQIRITSTKRSNILYNMKSKIPIVKKLLNNLKGKTIIFGNSIDSLLEVTPNVISSRNNTAENNLIRNNFEKNKINEIGSFKKLKQGANLPGLDNCILMSYYSTDKDFIQRVGRLRDNGEIGYAFIILTLGTQEEQWFTKMFENINNMNIIYCPDVDFAIKNYINDQRITE